MLRRTTMHVTAATRRHARQMRRANSVSRTLRPAAADEICSFVPLEGARSYIANKRTQMAPTAWRQPPGPAGRKGQHHRGWLGTRRAACSIERAWPLGASTSE
jgi:hypothetical protein